jgi:hypothetical protein
MGLPPSAAALFFARRFEKATNFRAGAKLRQIVLEIDGGICPQVK